MKFLVIVVVFFTVNDAFGQSEKMLKGTWSGGIAFDGSGEDSLLLFQFGNKGTFHFNYGVNHDFAHREFKLVEDTLIFLRNDAFQDPYFQIIELTESKLTIQALNLPALHVINTMCSPYNHAEYPLVNKDAPVNLSGVNLDPLRTTMKLERLTIN